MRLTLVILLFLFSTSLWANEKVLALSKDNVPPAFTASYSLSKGSLKLGQTNIHLKKLNEQTWEYYSATQAIGIASIFLGSKPVTDRATLTIIENFIKPTSFEHVQIKGRKDRSQRVNFNWNTNTAAASYKDRHNDIALSSGTFDNFSMQLVLMANIDQLPNEFSLPIISKAKQKEFYFYHMGNTTIETVQGNIETLLIERRKNDEKQSTYRIWADPNNYGLPLQIEKIENGKSEYIAKITASSFFEE